MRDWFYKNDERSPQKGPINRAELEERCFQGKLHPESLVWTEGLGRWKKIKETTFEQYLKAYPNNKEPQRTWFFRLDGLNFFGPLTKSDLETLFTDGDLDHDNLIWTKDYIRWKYALETTFSKLCKSKTQKKLQISEDLFKIPGGQIYDTIISSNQFVLGSDPLKETMSREKILQSIAKEKNTNQAKNTLNNSTLLVQVWDEAIKTFNKIELNTDVINTIALEIAKKLIEECVK